MSYEIGELIELRDRAARARDWADELLQCVEFGMESCGLAGPVRRRSGPCPERNSHHSTRSLTPI